MAMPNESQQDIEFILSSARSVRRKLDYETPISKEDLLACVNVAVQAPTGVIGENWRFLVVSDPKKKEAIAELYRSTLVHLSETRGVKLKPAHRAMMDRLHEIPVMVFILALGEPGESMGEQVGFFGSILPAAWSMMLAMRARGIGTTWTSLLTSRAEEIASILDIPGGVTQTVMLPAAYTLGAVLKPAHRLPAEEVTYWNGWNNLLKT